jgi:prepilin-type N-terminal cleavage/methylation domain-containing protein
MRYVLTPTARSRGFTLVEALIVMALLAGFLLILTTLLTSAIDIQGSSEGYSAVMTDGRFLMARLSYDIARASAVTTPGSLGASDSSLTLTISGTSYTYALSGDSLQLTDGSGSDNLNSNGTTVSNLSFQALGTSGGKETIRYSFTLTSTVTHTSGSDTQTYTSTEGLR